MEVKSQTIPSVSISMDETEAKLVSHIFEEWLDSHAAEHCFQGETTIVKQLQYLIDMQLTP